MNPAAAEFRDRLSQLVAENDRGFAALSGIAANSALSSFVFLA
jgi:hypothetical protein